MKKDTTHSNLVSLKTAIRTKDFEASKAFYTQILNLAIVQEYNDGNGSKGIILRFGSKGSNAFLEISEIKKTHDYFQEAFSESIQNDKIDLQLRTDDMSFWEKRLKGIWKTRGPVLRPWGSYYFYLKDPDGLQIIIYQENVI